MQKIYFTGGQLGIAGQLIASGYLASFYGWQAIFYVNGILGTVWSIAYLIFGSASPEQSAIISETELNYIQRSLGRSEKQKVTT